MKRSTDFWSLNPIERFVYAQQMVKLGHREFEPYTKLLPGGWRKEDNDGNGPWWFIFEEGGKTYITFRGQRDFELIKETFIRWRR